MTAAAAIQRNPGQRDPGQRDPGPSDPSEREQSLSPSPVPSLSAVRDDDTYHAREARAEGGVFRFAMIGAVLGAIVCAPIWAGLVAIALHYSGTALLPPLAMAAGVGVVAGVFIGGWAGTLVGATALERFEHENRLPARPPRT